MSNTVICAICGKDVLHVGIHIKQDHPEWTVERYQAEYPDAPIMSDVVRERLLAEQAKRASQINMECGTNVVTMPHREADRKITLADAFGLGNIPGAKNGRGNPIMVTRLGTSDQSDLVPEIDHSYIFNVELLRQVNLAFELNIPLLIWGHAGTGKTTVVQQVCARLNRPAYRVQHTLNAIESDVVGSWRAKDGNTFFDYGPLPLAMMHGWTYIADEYDRAPPGVLALYQAVLEGQPLVIKEAPIELRVVRPHRNFRFVATGNTNGAGDESGLYAGTLIGDAANYSRFGVTERAPYLPVEAEVALLRAKAKIEKDWAENLVRWANMIREAFDERRISTVVGPRELLYAAKVGGARDDAKLGVRSAVINRWSEVDRVIGEELLQRCFG